MKKKVVKYSAVSPAMRKLIRETIENYDVQFFSFPYKGEMEEGFLLEGEEDGEPINFLVIVDDEKKSTYKPDEEDNEEDEDFGDDIEELDGVVDKGISSDEDDDYDNDSPDDEDVRD